MVTALVTRPRRGESVAKCGEKKLRPQSSLCEDLMFRVRDPELWTSILNEDLVLKSQIVDGNFPAGSMGELLQRSLLESEKRADAGNVTPLKKPSNPE